MARPYESRKPILVTGSAGVLGSHLIDLLLEQRHEIPYVDSNLTGTDRNINHLHNHPRFDLVRHDVTLPLYLGVEEVTKLNCLILPIHYQHGLVRTMKPSVHGAVNIVGLTKSLH